MTRRLLAIPLAALLLLALTPDALFAWGPATHVYLGTEILRSLNLFPAPLASLLAAHPMEFLYGNISADITLAKRYAPVGRHSHHWHVAREMREAAGSDEGLQASAIGYMCHLAADVVAHGSFIPRMLLLTSSTRSLGHSYWEHRMDADVGAEYARLARSLVTEYDHSPTDELLDFVLARTLFSFKTNRRIFRGMIRVAGHERWQWIFDTVVDASRWELEDEEIHAYRRRAFELVADFLLNERESEAVVSDPIGEDAVERAKRVRGRVLRESGWDAASALQEAADRHFPLPTATRGLWEKRGGSPQVIEELRTTLLSGEPRGGSQELA